MSGGPRPPPPPPPPPPPAVPPPAVLAPGRGRLPPAPPARFPPAQNGLARICRIRARPARRRARSRGGFIRICAQRADAPARFAYARFRRDGQEHAARCRRGAHGRGTKSQDEGPACAPVMARSAGLRYIALEPGALPRKEALRALVLGEPSGKQHRNDRGRGGQSSVMKTVLLLSAALVSAVAHAKTPEQIFEENPRAASSSSMLSARMKSRRTRAAEWSSAGKRS